MSITPIPATIRLFSQAMYHCGTAFPPDMLSSMLSLYASSGTPHFSWNHSAAAESISGASAMRMIS